MASSSSSLSTTTTTAQMKSHSHLPTVLRSTKFPILLRTMEAGPVDALALSAILSEPQNVTFESDSVRAFDAEKAAIAVQNMVDSAAQPTLVEAHSGKVVSGPGRVNMMLVYTGGDGQEEIIGLGGFGSIKDRATDGSGTIVPPSAPLDAASAEDEVQAPPRSPFWREGDVGVMINPEFRGRGFAAEALRLAIEWAFRKADDGGAQLDRVTATTLVDNEAMVAVFERKMGWKGKRRPADRPGVEEVTYALTVEEWEGSR